MYITKNDLETLAASALKDPDPVSREKIQDILNRLNIKREKSNARTWDYIKKKREVCANYGRPKSQIKKLDISCMNL